jgi:peptidoglycan-associated lipoprotein
VTLPVALPADISHVDVYFEVGRKGLPDEAKALLSTQAGMLRQHEEYGILIQGYTDQQGSASYNRKLGLQRAESVKAELMKAGIAEHRIAVVSLGEEGVLCVDASDLCRRTNRRAHLEIRKIGVEHMAVPAASQATDRPLQADSTDDSSNKPAASPEMGPHHTETGLLLDR